MGICGAKAAGVGDVRGVVPAPDSTQNKSPTKKTAGGGVVLLVGERPIARTHVDAALEVTTPPEPTTTTSSASARLANDQPKEFDFLTPSRRLTARQVSGSLLSPDAQSRLLPGGLEPRRVSRPSTPISRSDNPALKPFPLSATSSLSHLGASLAATPPTNPLGWAVAPNSLTLDAPIPVGGSARSSKRRSVEELSTLIPETIQEKLRVKKDAMSTAASTAENALPPLIPGGSNPPSRRGSLERSVTISRVNVKKIADVSIVTTLAPLDSPPAGTIDLSHRNGNRKFGAKESELTDAQEMELRLKPFLFTDPSIFKFHISSVFSYYSTVPCSPTATSLPSINPGRIVFAQLQRLARDCTQRLYLIVRKAVKAEHTTGDEQELERTVWRRLEDLLPGHGNEAQTNHYVSLYLLDALAKTVAGSVGRREFAMLFPAAHQQLFCNPNEVNSRDRKRTISNIYKLKLEELLRARPLSIVVPESPEGDVTIVGSEVPPPQLYSPDPPLRMRTGERRRSLAGPLPSMLLRAVSNQHTANPGQPSLPRRSTAVRLPTGPALHSRDGEDTFAADSVERLIADLAPSRNTSRRGSRLALPTEAMSGLHGAATEEKERTSRQSSRRSSFLVVPQITPSP